MRASAVVIGGGISGLAAATRLAERSDPAGLVLIEGESRLGGKIRTERTDGFLLEGGPDCFLSTKPAGVELCHRLGLADRLIGTSSAVRGSFVKRAGRLYPLPEGITGLVPSRLLPLLTTGLLSLRGRMRAGLEVLVPPRRAGAEESVAEFARRRFGTEAYDWLIEPLLSGIFAGDGERLSLESTFPQLRATELRDGGLLRPLLTGRTPPGRPAAIRSGFVTLPGGLGELVGALATRLGGTRVLTGRKVRSIRPAVAGPGYRVELVDGWTLEAEAVVLATPAHATAAMVDVLDPDLAETLRSIPSVSTAIVSLAFAGAGVPTPLAGYGYVSPRIEGGPLVACTWASNKFPGRAPPDAMLVRCFIGRAGLDRMVMAEDGALHQLAREELREVHGITAPPLLSRVVRWPGGMPQYTLGHRDRLEHIATRLAGLPGLHLAGASYRGVGIPDCIVSGWAAADRVASRAGAA